MDQVLEFSSAQVAPPPEFFNFAAHLMSLNGSRSAKPAFIDDSGSLSYGELGSRVRHLASGLRDLGVKREERILLSVAGCE